MNETHRQTLADLLACCRAWEPDVRILGNVRAEDAAEALAAAIARMEAEQPVAWQWRRKGNSWSPDMTFSSEVFATTDNSEVRPLYTHPQPTRGPLTEAESAQIVRDASRGAATRRDGTTSTRIIRAVEAAHGITGEKP